MADGSGAPKVGEGGFVHLRVRSAYSLLEGAIKADKVARLAAAAQMPAVALADRANLFGALEFSQAAKEAGVQPLIACALPVSGVGEGRSERWARRPTVVLVAQDEAGWLNLTHLSSLAHTASADECEPCVAWAEVARRAEGLVLLSGGPDGPVDPLYAAGRTAEGDAALAAMAQAFGDRLYVELQRHDVPEGPVRAEALAEPELVRWAYAHDVPLVATNDAYFAGADMHAAHDALLCIADGAFLGQDERRKVTPEHRFKSAAEMRALFADLPEACDATLDIARRCAFLVKKRDPILPRFPTRAGRTEEEELVHQATEGLEARLAVLRATGAMADAEAAYAARLERELGVITRMGFSGYFLIVSDFIKWSKANGVPVGPGRGSGAGSLVAWALQITGLDPLRFGLLFERFLNPERVSMPDFDIDFCQDGRERVIEYVQGAYGSDRVAQIITFGTLQARAVLRDTGRVMQLPLGLVDRLAKMVPNNPANPTTLAQAIEIEPRLKEARANDPAVAKVLEVALKLEGLYRNASTHAAGVVIADRPLTELVPLYQDPRSSLPATQFNMKWVESAGLVKFDFLGLKTLTVLDKAVRHLKKRGVDLDLDTLALDDAKTYELLGSGQAMGVFQLESQGMRDTLRKLRCGSIEEITALISLYRPGPMDNIDTYVARKFGRETIDYLHPLLKPVLEETYGVIIYQEQVMQIAQILSGYSLGEADLLRRAMGKKKKEEMDLQKARFISGAKANGVPEAQSASIFEGVAKFAGYGFNKSHAAAYALIAYQTGWLKANAPVEFFAATMSLDAGNTDKLAVYHQDARRCGVVIRPPDINRSGADFEVEAGEVLYALGAVRGVGVEAMRHVEEVRARGGPFRDLFDFAERIDPKVVNKRVVESLARAGAFDALEPDRARALAAADVLLAHAQALSAERAEGQVSLFGEAGTGRPRLPKAEGWSSERRLDEELAAVGFYLTGHPLQERVEALRRRRVTLFAEAVALAEGGAEAFRMAGVVRRRQERAGQRGDKFAFVALSDPTGEYEVMFPPESLRRCRDALEPGAQVVIKVRAKGQGGEVRFFGDDAEPMARLLDEGAGALRVHVQPSAADVAAIRARVAPALAPRGAELSLVALLEGGREVEVKLPGRFRFDAALKGALKSAPGVLHLEEA